MDLQPSNLRIRLVAVDVDDAKAEVSVEIEDAEYVGRAIATDLSPARAAAHATLDAIAHMTPSSLEFRLTSMNTLLPHDGEAIVVVVVAVRLRGVTMRLVGAAPSRDDLEHTAARAVLDALNRRLQIMEIT